MIEKDENSTDHRMMKWYISMTVAVCLLVVVLSACSDTASTGDSSGQTATVAETPMPITDRALQVAQAVDPNASLKREGSSGPDVRYNVNVTFEVDGPPNDTNYYHYSAYTIYKALWQTPDLAKRLGSVLIIMISDLTVYPTQTYAKAYLTRETAQGIDWNNLNQDDAWEMYDEHEVYNP